jgi:multidrug transporter EmrE-like cation transporter
MGALFLTLSVVFNSIANGFFKVAAAIPELSPRKGMLLGVGLLIGLANTLCYLKALEEIDLGVAFPVFSAASIILIALLSVYFFHEALPLQRVAGMVLLCAGLLLIWKS